MEPTTHQHRSSRRNRGMVWLAAAAAAAGLGIGAAGIASAASTSSSGQSTVVTTIPASGTPSTSGTAATPPANAPKIDPATLPNGPGETVLTGNTAAKVKAAVEKAEPGATILRLETDSGGHAYEAHVKLANGTVKTLYFNSSFAADGSATGFGGRPGGPGGPGAHDGRGSHEGHRGHGAPGAPGAAPVAPATTTANG
jgi:hypothetical protein